MSLKVWCKVLIFGQFKNSKNRILTNSLLNKKKTTSMLGLSLCVYCMLIYYYRILLYRYLYAHVPLIYNICSQCTVQLHLDFTQPMHILAIVIVYYIVADARMPTRLTFESGIPTWKFESTYLLKIWSIFKNLVRNSLSDEKNQGVSTAIGYLSVYLNCYILLLYCFIMYPYCTTRHVDIVQPMCSGYNDKHLDFTQRNSYTYS